MTFEQGFAEVERAADRVLKVTAALAATTKALLRAARDGDVTSISKSSQKLAGLAETVLQEVSNCRSAWPFSPESEERFLKDEYFNELIRLAEKEGLKVQRRDAQLVSYPYIVRVLPSERVLRLNRVRVTGLRPTNVVSRLRDAQTKRIRSNVQPFLESLYTAYQLVAGSDGGTVPLAKLYRAFTLLPNSAAEYSRDDFARDLLSLDRAGITKTRSGASISLPASTGTKDSRDIFTCVAQDGEVITYYAVRFSGVSP